jgi:hypothetical protein
LSSPTEKYELRLVLKNSQVKRACLSRDCWTGDHRRTIGATFALETGQDGQALAANLSRNRTRIESAED